MYIFRNQIASHMNYKSNWCLEEGSPCIAIPNWISMPSFQVFMFALIPFLLN